MIKFCKETGVGIIPWSPNHGGFLAKPLEVKTARSTLNAAILGEPTEADKAINKRVQELAAKKGWKMSQVALAWLKGKGAIPIVGFSSTSIERLDDACALRDKHLTEEEIKFLEEPYVPKEVAGHH